MKSLLFVAVLIVATHALDQEFIKQVKQKMKENVDSCAKEVGASADDVSAILQHKVPDSHEGKCIFFCIHKIYNAQNEDGSLNMPGALNNLEMIKDIDPDVFGKVTTAFKNCESTPTDSDPCVFATSLVQCVVKEARDLGVADAIAE